VYTYCSEAVLREQTLPHPQGKMMGILTAAGSLARTLGPISVSALYQHTGPQITFASVDGLVFAGILILLVFCRKLVPYKKPTAQ